MVEDYTNAFFVSLFVLVFMGLFAIWAFWGLLTVMGVTFVADKLIGKPGRK